MKLKAALYLLASDYGYDTLPNHGKGDPANSAIKVTLSIVFAVTAAIAMLMIVIAGFRHIISAGDPQSVGKAKETIIYSVVGLLISLAAFSIVTFVVGHV